MLRKSASTYGYAAAVHARIHDSHGALHDFSLAELNADTIVTQALDDHAVYLSSVRLHTHLEIPIVTQDHFDSEPI